MSILETFYILFKTDATKAEGELKGADVAAEKLAESIDKAGKAMPPGQAREAAKDLGDATRKAADLDRGLRGAANQSRDVARGADKIGDELRQADREAARLGGSFVGMAAKLGALVGSAVSVGAVFAGIVTTFKSIDEAARTAERFGINTEGYAAFNGVIEDLGGNSEKAERTLRRFADGAATAFGDVESVQGKAFKALGVSLADADGNLKDTEQVLLDVAGALEGLGKQEQLSRLRELGVLDPTMRALLLKGRSGLSQGFADERAKGVITNDQVRLVHDLIEAWKDVKDEIDGFFNAMAGRWAPTLINWAGHLQRFFRFLRDHQTLVQGFAIGLSGALAVVAAAVWGTYVPAWTAAAVATITALAPVLAIGAAVAAVATAFALLWEDVAAFLRGQPSLLGDLVARYAVVRDMVAFLGTVFARLRDVAGRAWAFIRDAAVAVAPVLARVFSIVSGAGVGAFKGWWSVAGPIFALLRDALGVWLRINETAWRVVLYSAVEAFRAIAPVALPVLQAIGKAASWVGDVFAAVARGISNVWSGLFGWLGERLETVLGWARRALELVDKAREGVDRAVPRDPGVAAGQRQLQAARTHPLAAQTPASVAAGGSTRSRQTHVTVGKVEVHTQATDADGMARAAGGALSSHLRRTTAQYDDGVDR